MLQGRTLSVACEKEIPERIRATGENPINYIVRHMNLDPGSLGAEDQLANLQAVREGTRVFSAYELRDGTRIWIITEGRSDRHSYLTLRRPCLLLVLLST
jgi:hypothetical protein